MSISVNLIGSGHFCARHCRPCAALYLIVNIGIGISFIIDRYGVSRNGSVAHIDRECLGSACRKSKLIGSHFVFLACKLIDDFEFLDSQGIGLVCACVACFNSPVVFCQYVRCKGRIVVQPLDIITVQSARAACKIADITVCKTACNAEEINLIAVFVGCFQFKVCIIHISSVDDCLCIDQRSFTRCLVIDHAVQTGYGIIGSFAVVNA